METICVIARGDEGYYYLMINAEDKKTKDRVWAIDDDQVFAIAKADFIRNSQINYNEICT